MLHSLILLVAYAFWFETYSISVVHAKCLGMNSHGEGKKDTLDCARKTLISLWVVILQTNLRFDSLNEISFLLVASASNSLTEPYTLDTENLELPHRVGTLFRIHSSTPLVL